MSEREAMADFYRMEMGLPPSPLSFTGADLDEAYGWDGPDEDETRALNIAMERDMDLRRMWYEDHNADNIEEDWDA